MCMASRAQRQRHRDDETTPVDNPHGWRHSIAVGGGNVLEKEFRMSAQWLWLDKSQPDPTKGYMQKILKVYRIAKCRSKASGCKGQCLKLAGTKRKVGE